MNLLLTADATAAGGGMSMIIMLVAMFAIQFITDYNVISKVIALLIGAKA